MKSLSTLAPILALGTFAVAGPITTVPWNGHPGAASFTFDDGLHSQTTNLTFLNNMPDVSVTFFVCTGTMDFASNPKPHLEYAQKGHEIGNHTKNHKDLTTVNATDEITSAATTLRGMGQQVTSLATPYCSQNQTVKNAINQEHFINRGCGGSGLTSWSREPDWMQIDSHYWQGGSSNVQQFKGSLDQAANNQWHVMLNHGVGGDWDVISAGDIKTLIEYAVQKNLWVASFSTVGAYLRAHFTIDNANPTPTQNGFKVSWTSPHKHMPTSVPLKVKIQGAEGKTVLQKGKAVTKNSDGSYNIEFMDLELEVTSESAPENPSSSSSEKPSSSSSAQAAPYKEVTLPAKVEFENYDNGGEGVGYSDTDAINEGSEYRNDGVDIVTAESGYAVGHTMAGEWLQYTVNATSGKYKVYANVASGSTTSGFAVAIDGKNLAEISVPQTGEDWNVYKEILVGEAELTEGSHLIKVSITGSYVNLDWLDFRIESVQKITTPLKLNFNKNIQCQIFDMKGQMLKSINAKANSIQNLWANIKLAKGNYLVRLSDGQITQTLKLQK